MTSRFWSSSTNISLVIEESGRGSGISVSHSSNNCGGSLHLWPAEYFSSQRKHNHFSRRCWISVGERRLIGRRLRITFCGWKLGFGKRGGEFVKAGLRGPPRSNKRRYSWVWANSKASSNVLGFWTRTAVWISARRPEVNTETNHDSGTSLVSLAKDSNWAWKSTTMEVC